MLSTYIQSIYYVTNNSDEIIANMLFYETSLFLEKPQSIPFRTRLFKEWREIGKGIEILCYDDKRVKQDT